MGVAVDTTPGHPFAYYYEQVQRHRKDYLEKLLGKLVPGTPEYSNMQRTIDLVEKQQSGFGRLIGMEAAISVSRPNTEESGTREKVVTARYDLLRVFLAQRIEALEGRTSGSLEELKSRYFTDPPLDPFTGADFLLNPATGSYYSVGPDKADNTATPFQYDATNGTFSTGDLRNPPMEGK